MSGRAGPSPPTAASPGARADPVASFLERAGLGPGGGAGPAHALDPAAVAVLTAAGPGGFHELLRALIRGARREISLASLYLGTGAHEAELVGDLRAALARSPALRVRLVLDHSRARRATDTGTSASLLAPLLAAHPARFELYLHRMPQLAGALARLPSPLDECVAVFHLKALAFDDVALLTGANLSEEYFRCRQARSVQVDEPRLAALLHALVEVASRHSVRVRASASGRLGAEPPARDPRDVARAARRVVARGPARPGPLDAVVVPLIQHPRLRLQQERDVLRRVLAWPDAELVVATPYTNFPADYVGALAARLRDGGGARTLLLSPSGGSHSFTTGRGLKALVPGIYLRREHELALRLARAAGAGALAGRAELRHYDRPGWVFHAKGVWLLTQEVAATLIGSSSYGERSVARDFDLGLLLVTRDPALRAAVRGEVDALLSHTHPRRARAPGGGLAAKLLAPLVRRYL